MARSVLLLFVFLLFSRIASGFDVTTNQEVTAGTEVTYTSLDIKGGNLLIGDNATVNITGNVIFHYMSSPGSITLGENSTLNVSGYFDFQYVSGGPSITLGNGSVALIAGDIRVLEGVVNVNSNARMESTNGTMLINTNGRVNINGGEFIFKVSNTNVYNGQIRVENAGRFHCGGDLTMGTPVTVTGNSRFEVAGNFTSNAIITVDQASLLSVSKNFINQSSLSVTNSSILQLYQAYTNSSSLVLDQTSTLEYHGTAISGNLSVSNLDLRANTQLILDGNIVVSQSINFNSTVVKASYGSITVQNSDPGSVSFSSGFFITGSGVFSRVTTAENTYFFPVGFTEGTVNRLRPVKLTPAVTGNTFSVRATLGTAENTTQLAQDVRRANSRFYHTVYSSTSGALADMVIYFQSDVDGGWNKLGRYTSSWNPVNGGDILSDLAHQNLHGITGDAVSIPDVNQNNKFLLLNACGLAIWKGSETDQSWHTPSNWATGFVPESCDQVVFDNSSIYNCNISQNATAGSITFSENVYQVTQLSAAAISVVSGGFSITGGEFMGGAGNITVVGGFDLSGGQFTSTAGILNVSGDFSATAPGVFNHNFGTVKLNSILSGSSYTLQNLKLESLLYNLQIQGSFETSSPLSVTGSLEFVEGSGGNEILNQGPHNLYVGKDVAWNGNNLVQTTGYLIFNGAAEQTLSSSVTSPLLIANLRINKPSDIINSNVSLTVSGILDLTKGIIRNNGNILIEEAAALQNASPASYIAGPVSFQNKTAFLAPVGDLAFYRPVNLSNISGPSVITVNYHAGLPPSSQNLLYNLSSISNCEYWSLNGTATVTADAALFWNDNSCSAVEDVNLVSLTELTMDNIWSKVSSVITGTVSSGSAAGSVIVSNAEKLITLAGKAYFVINTEYVYQSNFKVAGSGLPDIQYTSGAEGTNNGIVRIIPDLTGETYPVTVQILQGDKNQALNLFFDLVNAQVENVRVELEGTVMPLSERVYAIRNGNELIFTNTPISDKNKPAITTNLYNGLLFLNNGTNTFEINLPAEITTATLTISDNTGNILFSNNQVVDNKITWNGRYLNESIEEIAGAGTYRFQLDLSGTVLSGKMIVRNE